MALTAKQVNDLNNMNKAAQDVGLGNLLNGNGTVIPAATTDAIGGVKKCVNVAEASGTTVTAAEFKALLDALKDAGIM